VTSSWHSPPRFSKYRYQMLLLAALLLGSCAQISSSPPTAAVLWQLNGKLSVNSPQGGGSGQFNWRIYPDRFEITLRGPLGYGTVRLSGTPQLALLEQGETRISGSIEQLSRQWLASELPLQALQYWADGQIAPSPLPDPDSARYNVQQQLTEFSQMGWQLLLSRYPDNEKSSKPNKINGQKGEQRFTLIVQSRGDQP